MPQRPIFDLRQKSLPRANLLVGISVVLALLLSDFPNNRATPWLIVPSLLAIAGTADTVRNMRRKWGFYHAGVILCIYMDLMAVVMILFFLVYPYGHFLSATH